MIRFEKAFYAAMLWFMRFDLAIAKSTGRNPKQIQVLRNDVANMESFLDLLEVNCE